jgi:hypothetical protein
LPPSAAKIEFREMPLMNLIEDVKGPFILLNSKLLKDENLSFMMPRCTLPELVV